MRPPPKNVIDKDGWLHTNDVARMTEDGYFQIISRRQDSWQGEDQALAFPRDVEEVVYELPEVREVVVVGIANQPVAFVSLKEKTRIPAKTIIQFCQRRLPPSQVPRLVIFVKDFPAQLHWQSAAPRACFAISAGNHGGRGQCEPAFSRVGRYGRRIRNQTNVGGVLLIKYQIKEELSANELSLACRHTCFNRLPCHCLSVADAKSKRGSRSYPLARIFPKRPS